MQYSILGDDLQLVKVIMDEGESIYGGEGGHLLYKSPTVNLQARDVGGASWLG